MTPKQLKGLYFPVWNAARRVLDSNPNFHSSELRALYRRILAIAHERAVAEASFISSDDFRHACHLVALGKYKSAKQLTNAELDKVLALFRLIISPDDLDAQIAWGREGATPESLPPGARNRLLWWLRNKCVESYIVELARERFGTKDWENLPDAQLQQLHMTLKNRSHSHLAPTLNPALADANDPF